jgi:predicted double-glycine peptidase
MYAKGDQAQIRKVGFSLLDMKKYLESQGYSAEGYTVTSEDLKVNPEPSITMIDLGGYKHFVVIKGFADGKVLVGDPAAGVRAYPLPEFEKMWQKVILVIENGPKPAFNQEADWRPYGNMFGRPLSDASLQQAAIDRELSPRYQIAPVFVIPPSTSFPR